MIFDGPQMLIVGDGIQVDDRGKDENKRKKGKIWEGGPGFVVQNRLG